MDIAPVPGICGVNAGSPSGSNWWNMLRVLRQGMVGNQCRTAGFVVAAIRVKRGKTHGIFVNIEIFTVIIVKVGAIRIADISGDHNEIRVFSVDLGCHRDLVGTAITRISPDSKCKRGSAAYKRRSLNIIILVSCRRQSSACRNQLVTVSGIW